MTVFATENRRLRIGRRTFIELIRGAAVDVVALVEGIGQAEVDALLREGVLSTKAPTIGRRFPRSQRSVWVGVDQRARP